MKRRSGKFYRQNEREVMESLNLSPTSNSGSGWLQKEDGESESVLCQLKSTDAQSISVKQKDLHALEYHAQVSNKIPVFAVQFLSTGEVWLMVRPSDLEGAALAMGGGNVSEATKEDVLRAIAEVDWGGQDGSPSPVVESDPEAQKAFREEMDKEMKDRRRRWLEKR